MIKSQAPHPPGRLPSQITNQHFSYKVGHCAKMTAVRVLIVVTELQLRASFRVLVYVIHIYY